jgi:microcystin-dependent protein
LNSTPDLRNRFIVGAGAGGSYAPAAVGGFQTQFPTVTIYNSGSHTHSLSGATQSSVTGITLNKTIEEVEDEQNQIAIVQNASITDPGHAHTLGGQADTNGIHTHTGDVSSFDNRPPYYALCYIMKG